MAARSLCPWRRTTVFSAAPPPHVAAYPAERATKLPRCSGHLCTAHSTVLYCTVHCTVVLHTSGGGDTKVTTCDYTSAT